MARPTWCSSKNLDTFRDDSIPCTGRTGVHAWEDIKGVDSKIVGQMKIRLYTPSQIVLNWGFNTLPASCLTTWPLSRSCAPAARKLSIQFRGRRCCCWESGPPQKIDALQRRWQLCWWSWRPSILKRTMSSDDFFWVVKGLPGRALCRKCWRIPHYRTGWKK